MPWHPGAGAGCSDWARVCIMWPGTTSHVQVRCRMCDRRLSSKNDNTKTNTAWNGPHRLCPHSLSHRSSSSTAAPAPRGHHKPERIGHYELLPRRLGNPTTGACPCRSARTRATPAAAAPARQRASKRHAGWLSRVWAVLRGTVRRGTQPRPHTHTHAHSYQPVCIINTYYLTYPTPHTRDARLGRR